MSSEQNDPMLASEEPVTSDQDTSEMTNSSKRKLGGFNLSISQKLIGVVSLIIILLVVVAGTGIYQMQLLADQSVL